MPCDLIPPMEVGEEQEAYQRESGTNQGRIGVIQSGFQRQATAIGTQRIPQVERDLHSSGAQQLPTFGIMDEQHLLRTGDGKQARRADHHQERAERRHPCHKENQ